MMEVDYNTKVTSGGGVVCSALTMRGEVAVGSETTSKIANSPVGEQNLFILALEGLQGRNNITIQGFPKNMLLESESLWLPVPIHVNPGLGCCIFRGRFPHTPRLGVSHPNLCPYSFNNCVNNVPSRFEELGGGS